MTKATMTATPRYDVVYQCDEAGWWQARVPTVPGCQVQGPSLEEARRRITEKLQPLIAEKFSQST